MATKKFNEDGTARKCHVMDVALFGTGQIDAQLSDDKRDKLSIKAALAMNVYQDVDTGAWLFNIKATGAVRLWGATITMFFEFDPVVDLVVLAFKIDNLNLAALPFIRDIQGAENFGFNLYKGIIYFANKVTLHETESTCLI